MKKLLIGFLLLVAMAPAWSATRTALIIGNADYADSPLQNAANDAKDMADLLQNLGFAIIYRVNADRRTMRAAIREFTRSISKGGVGLFYYAGHGVQSNGVNYLIPIGADIKLGYEVPDETVSANSVLRAMESAGNDLNVVILDACRNNPYGSTFRSASRGLAVVNAPTGSLVAYATAPGKIAEDGEGRNGIYTKHLLEAIQTPGLDLEDVFKRVRVKVEQETGGAQVPWEESSLRGDFYFIEKQKEQVASIQPQPAAITQPSVAAQNELMFWQGIQNSRIVEDYEEYLRRYPQGLFAPLARSRISGLGGDKVGNNTNADQLQKGQQKTDPLAPLLQRCESAVQSNRLTTGENNALDCYRAVLAEHPGNREALRGIAGIEEKYVNWAQSALVRGDLKNSKTYTAQLARVNPTHLALPALKLKLRELEVSKQLDQAADTAKTESDQAARQKSTAPQPETTAAKPQPTPENPLHKRLRQCDAYVESNHLLTGKDNAFKCYTEVIDTEPDNAWAVNGIALIGKKYVGWARSSLARGDADKTALYLDRLAKVDPDHESLPFLKLKLRALELSLQSATETASTGSKSSVGSSDEDLEKEYVKWAQSALDRGDAATARVYIDRLSDSNPQHALLPRLKLRLRALELSQQSNSGQGSTTVSSATRSLSVASQITHSPDSEITEDDRVEPG